MLKKIIQNHEYKFLYLGALLILLMQNINAWDKIKSWHLPDSDDVAKVLQVRAWLNGQGFYDLFNHRSNPPFGGEMHWSRLAEMPLALFELMLKPFFGNELGEKLAIYIVPLLLGAVFIIIGAIIVKKLTNSEMGKYIAAVIILCCSNVLFSFWPGRVDHHGLQLICLFLMFLGFIMPNKFGGMIAGIALAASLTIGFEALPIQILMMAWVIIVWLLNNKDRNNQLVYFCFTLAIFIIIGFFINVAPENFAKADNDRLSIAQVLPILFGAISFGLLINFGENFSFFKKLFCLSVIGIGVLIIGAQFPILLKPLYWQVTPLLHKLWLSDVGETFPIYRFPIGLQISLITFPLFSIIAFLIKFGFDLKNKEFSKNRVNFENWILLGGLLIFSTLLICIFQVRLTGQATSFALLVSGAIITLLINTKNLSFGLMAALFINPIIPNHIEKLVAKLNAPKQGRLSFGEAVKCRSMNDFAHLAKLEKGLVISNINLGAEILLMTNHDVLTTHFHRDTGKNLAYDIFLSPPDVAKIKLQNAKIDYIAFCNRAPEMGNMARYAPNGLVGHVVKNKLPNYLEEILPASKSDIRVYRINK
ncbi:MAG: hypothetical protein J0L55_13870 [Caulobacterales bacterium]|nr:hypothetical protein [Caulobacterales bacterium]